MACTFNPKAEKAETWIPEAHWLVILANLMSSIKDPFSQKQGGLFLKIGI